MTSQATAQAEERNEFWAKRWDSHRAGYLRSPLYLRLGELAWALSTARSFSDPSHPSNRRAAERMFETSQYYIEWTAAETAPDLQSELAALHQQLADWLEAWPNIWDDAERRAAMAAQAGDWSQKILERSGVLDPEVNPR